MANLSVSSYIAQFSSSDWTHQCLQNIVAAGNQSIGYVGKEGRPLPHFEPNETWGIDRETCIKFCNSTAIPLVCMKSRRRGMGLRKLRERQDFQFQTFAGAFVNYLLPWLGLIAQLPTETESKNDGFMSLCMAVGSPALITYSLMLTIRNRALVREEFDVLRRHVRDVQRMYRTFGQRLDAIQYVLEEAQQVPLRVSQEQGWFSSLTVVARNEPWWENLEGKLKDTRRGRTLSLVFQMGVAILAWILTIIAAFVSSLGDISTGLQISASNIWVWMVSELSQHSSNLLTTVQIPVILGWIRVGTQQLPKSIDKALETENAFLALGPPNVPDSTEENMYTESKNQRGLVVVDKRSSGLTPQTRRTPQLPPEEYQRISQFFNIRGDEKRRGPAFNYARTFTYCHLIRTITQALQTTIDNICDRNTCSGEHEFQEQGYRAGLLGNGADTEAYCGLDSPDREIYAYPEWSEIPSEIWIGIGFSAILALVLQWGTTGAALMIAYLTPTKGLGCRSGAYLLYGTNATVAWSLLAMSSLFSHSAMLRYQNEKQKEPLANARAAQANGAAFHSNGTGERVNDMIPLVPLGSSAQSRSSSQPRRRISAAIWNRVPVRGLAAVTRYFGKFLAVANAFFLVAVSLFEFTGGFDNCWCKSDTVGCENLAGWCSSRRRTIWSRQQAYSGGWGSWSASWSACLRLERSGEAFDDNRVGTMLYDHGAEWDPIWHVDNNLLSHAKPLFGMDEYDESVAKLANIISIAD